MRSDKLKLAQMSGNTFQIKHARRFFQRAAGLIFCKKLHRNQCLLITPCRSVHTIGMRYTLDVVFIDAFGLVTDVYLEVRPFRMITGSTHACSVVEFLGGNFRANQLKIGQPLFAPI